MNQVFLQVKFLKIDEWQEALHLVDSVIIKVELDYVLEAFERVIHQRIDFVFL